MAIEAAKGRISPEKFDSEPPQGLEPWTSALRSFALPTELRWLYVDLTLLSPPY